MDSPEARRRGVEALCQEIKNEINIDIVEKIEVLMQLWLQMGIGSNAIRSRLLKTKSHVLRLLNDMYEGEIEMKARIVENIERCTADAQTLAQQLGMACELPPEEMPILDRETKIRELVEKLKRAKEFRKKEARKLIAEEKELCRSLEEVPHALSGSTSLLSESDMLELSRHVAALRQEKAIRNCKFSTLRSEIIAKLDLLDLSPEEGLEQQIVAGGDDFVLSDKNMEFVQGYLLRLKSLEVERRKEHAALMERVALFWERLDIEPQDQEDFRRSHEAITLSSLSALKQQLEVYEKMKKERVKEFIDSTKDDLLTFYTRCCVPERKARFEKDEDSEDFSDQRLEELEAELRSLKKFHAEHKQILMKVERREALWARFLEFEMRAGDPSRLTNRGGRLLLEMRERKRLEAELPRLEDEIKAYINMHTGKEKEQFFTEWAKDFLDHLGSQHEAYNMEKDRERQERENRRKEPGSTPVSHRCTMKRGPPCTPSSSASRFSRLGASTATTPTPSMTSRNTTAGKSGLRQRGGGTPMRTAPTAKNIRRRSITGAAQKGASKAVKKLLESGEKKSPRGSAVGGSCSVESFAKGASKAARKLRSGAKASPRGGAVGGPSSMDSFAHYLSQPDSDRQLTSSVLGEPPATPQPQTEGAALNTDVTLRDERTPAGPLP